jgi:leader peptidase (prepilin peptidase)/N-methyltransferase
MDLMLNPQLPLSIAVCAAAILGAIIGSFLGAALERLPAGRSIVTGRSRCDGCGTALTVQDLVPILSFAMLRGRCRTCGGAIGWWQWWCEIGAAAIAVASVFLARDGLALAAMVFGWQLLLLALLDLRHLWLPRWLTILLAANGLLLALARTIAAHDGAPLLVSLGGALFGWGMLWLASAGYRLARGQDGMGGGDPPLMGAIGLWVGPLGVVHVVLVGALGGLLVAIALHVAGRRMAADTALPLGTCLAAAAWPVFLIAGFG